MPTRGELGREGRIAAFWQWWTANRDAVRLSVESGTAGRLVAELTRAVRAVDARLAWELMPGETSRHLLVVTGEGDPDAAWVAA